MNNVIQIEFDRPLFGVTRAMSQERTLPEIQDSEKINELREKLAEREQKLQELRNQLTEYENVYRAKQEEMERISDQLVNILEEAQNSRAALIQDNEEEMVNFCLELTEKVLQHEIEHGRYKIEKILQNALDRVQDSSQVIIRVNPGDHDDAHDALSWLRHEQQLDDVELIEDDNIPAASCRIEFDSGSLIFDIHDRLQKIENEIMKKDGGQ